MSEFAVTVVTRPTIRTAGMKIRTTMKNALAECSALWEKEFGPRMATFPVDPHYPNQSYGVSVMLDSDSFDYWAVMAIAPDAAVPEGMDRFEIPGGLYAECPVVSLGQIGEAFEYMFMQWIPAQERYACNMQGVGLELYTQEYLTNGSFTLYSPLVEK